MGVRVKHSRQRPPTVGPRGMSDSEPVQGVSGRVMMRSLQVGSLLRRKGSFAREDGVHFSEVSLHLELVGKGREIIQPPSLHICSAGSAVQLEK